MQNQIVSFPAYASSILGGYKNQAMTKEKLKAVYKTVELDLLIFTQGKCSAYYFLRHILCCLRQYPNLCEQNDYKKLYDETVTLLILYAQAESSWSRERPKEQTAWIEFFADLENKNISGNFEFYSLDIINSYLSYRRKKWESGEWHSKERYGFLS